MPELPQSTKKLNVKTKTKPRKYKTSASKWRRIRWAQLQKEPLCRHCKEQGRTTPGNTVDHISGDTWDNTQSNLQTLCVSCHTIKTNTHDGGLGRARDRLDGGAG